MWRHALAVAAVGLVPPGLLALLLTGFPALDPGLGVGWGVGLAVWLAGAVVGLALRANRDVYGYRQGDASVQRDDARWFYD